MTVAQSSVTWYDTIYQLHVCAVIILFREILCFCCVKVHSIGFGFNLKLVSLNRMRPQSADNLKNYGTRPKVKQHETLCVLCSSLILTCLCGCSMECTESEKAAAEKRDVVKAKVDELNTKLSQLNEEKKDKMKDVKKTRKSVMVLTSSISIQHISVVFSRQGHTSEICPWCYPAMHSHN